MRFLLWWLFAGIIGGVFLYVFQWHVQPRLTIDSSSDVVQLLWKGVLALMQAWAVLFAAALINGFQGTGFTIRRARK